MARICLTAGVFLGKMLSGGKEAGGETNQK
jgi:hypothetical protein